MEVKGSYFSFVDVLKLIHMRQKIDTRMDMMLYALNKLLVA